MDILERIEQERRSKLSISHHPELEGRFHMLRQTASGIMLEEMATFADYAEVYKVYTWVKKALSVIANNFAPLPVRVVDEEGEAIDEHPVSRLLMAVNDQMTPPALWERYIVHKFLGGEAFFEVVEGSGGAPFELWPRRPNEVGLKPDVSEERALFPRVAQYLWPDEDGKIEPEMMWHDKFYNPRNEWRGLAPIAAVRHGIVIDMFAQAWSKAFLRSGARPDYAYISGVPLTRTEKKELEFEIQQRFAGPGNNHKPIILDPDSDVKPLMFVPKDIEWLEQRKFSRDEVGAIFGVPDGIMGYGRETYDNSDRLNANMKALWTITLLPLVERRDASLTHFFSKQRTDLEPGLKIQTDISGVGVLQEDDSPKIEKAKNLFSIGVPFNTIDDRLDLGIGEIPGGDVGYLPGNLLPIGSSVREDAGNDNGGPPDEEMATVAPDNKQVVEYGSARHKALWDRHRARLTEHERGMQRELKRQFQAQQNDVLRRFRELAGSGSAQEKVTIEIPGSEDLFNVREQQQLFVSVFTQFFTNGAQAFGQAEAENIGIDFDLQDPFVQAEVERLTQKFAVEVTQTTFEGVQGALSQTLEEGLSIPEAQDLLSDVFDARKSDFETERIARTELNRVSSMSQLSAGRQARALGLNVKKAWLAALDTRTRQEHVAAHIRYQLQPIGLEEDFEIGACAGPGPGQTGCAEHDINCRCTITMTAIR